MVTALCSVADEEWGIPPSWLGRAGARPHLIVCCGVMLGGVGGDVTDEDARLHGTVMVPSVYKRGYVQTIAQNSCAREHRI